jgi:hypothetical protein
MELVVPGFQRLDHWFAGRNFALAGIAPEGLMRPLEADPAADPARSQDSCFRGFFTMTDTIGRQRARVALLGRDSGRCAAVGERLCAKRATFAQLFDATKDAPRQVMLDAEVDRRRSCW